MSAASSGNRYAALDAEMDEDGVGAPQAQASPEVSENPHNPKFVVCNPEGRSGMQVLNGADLSSADAIVTSGASALSESAQGAVSTRRNPLSTPLPRGTLRQDVEMDEEDGSNNTPTSWEDLERMEEEESAAASAAAAAAAANTPPARQAPSTSSTSRANKRKDPPSPVNAAADRSLVAEREADREGEAELNPIFSIGSLPAAGSRRSTRIRAGGISPATERQQVVTGIRRHAPAAGAEPPRKSSKTVPGQVGLAASQHAPQAESRPGRSLLALERRINAGLDRRQQREDSVREFLGHLTTGLRNMDGLNALGREQIATLDTLLHVTAKVVLAKEGTASLPEPILTYLDKWDPSKPAPALPTSSSPTGGASANSTGSGTTFSFSWAARAAAGATAPATPAPKRGPRPLKPHEGYRTQGGTKGDAERLAEAGGAQDNRAFIRFGPDHPARNEDPISIRRLLENALRLTGAPASLTFGRLKKVDSGFSFTPGDQCTQADLEPHYAALAAAVGAERIDGPSKHRQVCLRGLPAKIVIGGAARPVEPEDVEFHLQHHFPSLKMAAPPRIITPPRNPTPFPLWLITFSEGNFGRDEGEPTPSRVVLMDRDCTIRPYRTSNASKHCARCLSWHHTTTKCRSPAPTCAHCGLTGHSASEHTCRLCLPGKAPVCVPECFHCKGPATTGHPGCKARPVWDSKVNAVVVPEGERLLRLQNKGRADRKLEVTRLRSLASCSTNNNPTSTPTVPRGAAAPSLSNIQTSTPGASGPRDNALATA